MSNGARDISDLPDDQCCDTFTIYSGSTEASQSKNIYLRNNVFRLGQDEVIDVGGFGGYCSNDIVFHDNIIAEGLQQVGGHFSACFINYCNDADDSTGLTLYGNYFAGCTYRTPDYKGKQAEFINNIVVAGGSGSPSTASRGGTELDIFNNVFLNCPAGNCFQARENTLGTDGVNQGASGAIDNLYSGNLNLVNRNAEIGIRIMSSSNAVISDYTITPVATRTPHYWTSTEQIQTTDEVIASLADKAPKLVDEFGDETKLEDSFLTRVKNYFYKKESYITGSEEEWGGYPEYPTPVATYADTDSDGMPDAYELAYGFPVATPNGSEDADGDQYTNLEEYLNFTNPRGEATKIPTPTPTPTP